MRRKNFKKQPDFCLQGGCLRQKIRLRRLASSVNAGKFPFTPADYMELQMQQAADYPKNQMRKKGALQNG
ncbi:hypothetical protein HMPREF9120_01708 [Neisseria sp. oral taxon 020 str. F0370]|nr:hypothetical protein HMPREF9120_01708 [Neisseria sp. oral taxon 020 str. F0370]